ncbi:unnamed protein product [Paramecium primaurelia]|uniref:Protein kinase domain-containing protein n=1 Tax=Paramecium primaurelia TaxID=5886 RepID=A0A8S1QM20_PARPR|nr:unnamed protein product [Paramecium primaurelia]
MQQIQQNWVGKLINAATSENPNRNYRIENVLGQGSQGSVYLGKHIINNFQQIDVAIKIQSYMSEQEIQFLKSLIQYQNQYENNKQNLQNYNPSYIIRIFDFFQHNNDWILVMELGTQDLYKFIQSKHQLPIQQLGQLLKQITKSISFLHDKQLLHRDIKPENYIQIGDEYKLTDFGLITTQFRQKTTNVGTVLYQAPELISNLNNYTQAIDIWSLGCIFYEVLSGQTLIQGTTQDQIQKMILAHKQDCTLINQRINSLNCNKDIKDMIIRMMDPNPLNRLKTQQIIEILDSKFSFQKFPIINQFPQQLNIPFAQNNQFPLQYQQIPQQQQGIIMQFNQQNQSQQQQLLVDMQKQLSQQQILLESITTNFKFLVGIVEDTKNMMNEIKKGQEQQKIEINQIKNDISVEIQSIINIKLDVYQNNIISKIDKICEEQEVIKINQQKLLVQKDQDFITQFQESINDKFKNIDKFMISIQQVLQENKLEKKEFNNQVNEQFIAKQLDENFINKLTKKNNPQKKDKQQVSKNEDQESNKSNQNKPQQDFQLIHQKKRAGTSQLKSKNQQQKQGRQTEIYDDGGNDEDRQSMKN